MLVRLGLLGTGANLGREWVRARMTPLPLRVLPRLFPSIRLYATAQWRKGGQNCVASYGRSRAPALTRSKCFDATRPTLASPASPNSKSPAASPIDHKSNGSFSTTTGPGGSRDFQGALMGPQGPKDQPHFPLVQNFAMCPVIRCYPYFC
ncbi:hypothetical protein BC826DRAFT_1047259 [Russula brevipes]|nr:hypothetical protein BC826DRAFT_1047259 [Russula brevipes]